MKSSDSEPTLVVKATQTLDGFKKVPVSSRIDTVKTTMPALIYRRS